MTGRGRPIRFLALVGLGWVGARIALLWSATGSLPEAIRAFAPIAAAPDRSAAPRPVRRLAFVGGMRTMPPPALRVPAKAPRTRPVASPAADPERVQMALMGLIQYGVPVVAATRAPPAAMPLAAQPAPLAALPSRWSASAWLVARAGAGIGAAPGASQLGGGQAGLRVAWLAWPAQRLAAVARVVAPLRGSGAEASVGLEWQPTRIPARLVVERRFGLDGTRGGTGIGVIAGFDGVAKGFRLESYGQAGTIRRRRTEAYADGAVRATRTLADSGGVRLALGSGIWGAAQRDAARLDIGPSATLALPLGKQNVRVALDWRQRVAGGARPGSGLALTLGSDF